MSLRAQDGVALTVSMFALAMMMTLAGIALNQAIGALGQSTEQTHVKRALQAADAAIDAAAYGISRVDVGAAMDIDPVDPSLGLTQNCIVTTGDVGGGEALSIVPLDAASAADPEGDRWCQDSGAAGTTDGATYSYRLSQLARVGAGGCGSDSGVISLDREVVGVGESGGVVRRVRAQLTASLSLLSGAAVQSSSESPMTMAGTAKILGDAQSNGPITGTGVNVISGNATPGVGHTVSGVVPAGSDDPACTPFTIPRVDPGTVDADTNDNTAFTPSCLHPLTMLPALCLGGGVQYDPELRTLRIHGRGRAILTGTDYSFCKITMEGTAILQVPSSGTPKRIFLDDPENCVDEDGDIIPGAGTMNVAESTRIINCNPETAPESLQIYALGNPDHPTVQTIATGALLTPALRGVTCGAVVPAILGVPLTLIAPHSTVSIAGSTAISGQVAAELVQMAGAASVNPINALVNISRLGGKPVLPLYQVSDYRECTGKDFDALPPEHPSQGC